MNSTRRVETQPNIASRILLLVTSILVASGFLMILSTSYFWSLRQGQTGTFMFQNHLIYFFICLFCFWAIQQISLDTIYRNSWIIYGGSLVLLALVLIPEVGTGAGGARRWLRFGGIGFQPSEFAKLAVILVTARMAASDPELMSQFRYGFLRVVFVIGAPCVLIVLEPDLGTTAIVGTLGMLVALAGGIRLLYVLPSALIGIPLIGTVFWIFHDHFRQRIQTFLESGQNPLDTGYQIQQSLIALGSGGLFGKGPGQSLQKLFYLPHAHNDFIFSILGEEYGFLGTSFIVGCFIVLFLSGLHISRSSRNRFHQLLALGLTLALSIQALLNLAVVTGSFPTKGLPLPFISYGGSSLLTSTIMIAILYSIAHSNTCNNQSRS